MSNYIPPKPKKFSNEVCPIQVASYKPNMKQTSQINKFIPPQMCKLYGGDSKLKFESVVICLS